MVGNGEFLKTKEPGIGSFFIIENFGVLQYSLFTLYLRTGFGRHPAVARKQETQMIR